MALSWKSGDDPKKPKPAKPSLWDRLNQPIGGPKDGAGKKDGSPAGDGAPGAAAAGAGMGVGGGAGPVSGSDPSGDVLSPRDKAEHDFGRAPEPGVAGTGVGSDLSSGATAPVPVPHGSAEGQGPAEGGAPAGADGKGSGLNREISFGKKKSASLPAKRTMNLYQPAKGGGSGRQTAIVGACLLAAVLLFVRFAVMGPLQQVADKQQQLADVQAQLQPIHDSIADYDDVMAQYQEYTPASSSSGVDATATFTLIDQHVRTRATVTHVKLQDTTLTIDVSDVTLKSLGEICADVAKQQSLGVKSASVTEAAGINPSSGLTDQSIVTGEISVELVGSGSDDSGSSSQDSGSAGSTSTGSASGSSVASATSTSSTSAND